MAWKAFLVGVVTVVIGIFVAKLAGVL